ncbi:MAG: glycine cleavage system aminomethyltransferase GcvT, partial [Candidatus Krumholzibacteriia bacterium]
EHSSVRRAVGMFDVSHMGELFFSGPGALETLDNLATNDVARMVDGQAIYTAFCNEQGGVRDDALIYRFDGAHFMMVVNAANTKKIVEWSQEHLQPGTEFENRSDRLALLALQGPRSLEILERAALLGHLSSELRELPYYRFLPGGQDLLLVSRTGYTGELGFEIYLAWQRAGDLWEELLHRGRSCGLGPAGLGARDTLRFEAGFRLYGHELGEDVTPLESGIGWAVKLRKPRFIGREALVRQKAAGVPRKLIGLEVRERAIARQGFEVRAGGRAVGRVTSGTYAPTLRRRVVWSGVAAAPWLWWMRPQSTNRWRSPSEDATFRQRGFPCRSTSRHPACDNDRSSWVSRPPRTSTGGPGVEQKGDGSMADTPSHLKYTAEHEWVKLAEDGTATVGITDFAQSELGDIVYVELPQEGDTLTQAEPFGTIEAVKTVEDLYAPLSGEVIEVNAQLQDAPTLINSSPYEDGWILKLRLGDSSGTGRLLTAEQYGEQIGETG